MERWKFVRFEEFAMPGAGMFLESDGDWVDADEAETEIAKLQDALAEAQREIGDRATIEDNLNRQLAESQRENEELRADLVWCVEHAVGTSVRNVDPHEFMRSIEWGEFSFEGPQYELVEGETDADLCRAIREARRGE